VATTKVEDTPLRTTALFMYVIAGLLLLGGLIAATAVAAHTSAIAFPVLLFVGCFTAAVIVFGIGRLLEAVGELRLRVVGD
jgi:hypothetical protein